MTWIKKAAAGDEAERGKWREQANKSAAHLKTMKFADEQVTFMPAFAFDDGMVNLPVPVAFVRASEAALLADWIFDAVLSQVTDHAAPPADLAAAPDKGAGEMSPAPAAAAVLERCWRRIEPTFTEQCANNATGGVRLSLFAAEAVQKRWGKRCMLRLVLDLPVCPECFAKMTPAQVISDGLAPGQWGDISKTAQRMNAGILPVKENSLIEHVPFDDPEYAQLRSHIAKHHAAKASNDSQPAPSGATT